MAGLVAGGASVALLVLFWPTSLGGDTSYVVVRGVSMEPTLQSGELAVMRTHDGYTPGDVVAYRVPEDEFGEGAVVIHRIVGGNAEDGFVVQGDNKEGPDRWIPKPENIVGKMWFQVPGGGDWFAKLREPLGRGAVIGGLGLFLLLGHNLSEDEVRRRVAAYPSVQCDLSPEIPNEPCLTPNCVSSIDHVNLVVTDLH